VKSKIERLFPNSVPCTLFTGDRGRIPSGRATMSGSFIAGKLRLLVEKLHIFVYEYEELLIFVTFLGIGTIP
jgi:hypothetical protein